MKNTIVGIAIGVASVTVGTGMAWADPIGLGGSFQRGGLGVDHCASQEISGGFGGWSDSLSHAGSFDSHSPCSVTTQHGEGTGQAEFGSLQATADAIARGGSDPLWDGSLAGFITQVYWTDQVMVTTSGQLTFSLALVDTLLIDPGGVPDSCGPVTGIAAPWTTTNIGNTCALASASMLVGGGPVIYRNDTTNPSGGIQNVTTTINVVAGQLIDVAGYLRVGAGACRGGGPNCLDLSSLFSAESVATASASFFIDTEGGASYTTGSGHTYDSASSTVPEPATLVLTGSGLLAVVRRRLRRIR